MSKCKSCNVQVADSLSKCPLCLRIVNMKPKESAKEYPLCCAVSINSKKKFITKICLFASIFTIVTCIFINFSVDTENWWSTSVTVSILYAWLLIKHTIFSRAHVGAKILFQVIGLSVMLFLIDLSSTYLKWSVNFVIPLLVIAATLLITSIIFTRSMRWNEYVGYQFAVILLGFIPIVLYFINVTDIFWPSSSSALHAFFTLVFMLVFSNKKYKAEFIRRFHF